MIDGTKLSPWEQIYTFVARDGTNIHIHSSRLRLHCLAMKYEPVYVPVDRPLAKSFICNNVVHPPRVMGLTPENLFEPIILCKTPSFGRNDPLWPDVLLVDGHHRFTRMALDHIPQIRAFLLELHQWQDFTVVNIPSRTQQQLTNEPILPKPHWNNT